MATPQHARLAESEADEPRTLAPAAAPTGSSATGGASTGSPQRADEGGEPLPQVAVLPSGEMVYLSKDNPYARTYAEHADSSGHDASGRPGDDPYAVPIPPALLASFQQPIILERMGRIVRLLAMFDLVRAAAPQPMPRPGHRAGSQLRHARLCAASAAASIDFAARRSSR